ncbi:uncharacterized protein LOC8272171 [Ricinus communis]|uniref:Uncharacterized protein n=1 Tax=Ricinus communis TaxID=3988 RepID=B9T0Z0_RICCO|nr:uncharacterized protein LOC8272171 [Ricinus communis]XP_015582538.1 uncharacterized protein LOC8272171 [Ricinus communis]EEF30482.1 conserved hypothetical protein [Ricinus communis]|eukprot:XP_002531909.1 uncharacterized protein LOC8272171 [Ricinus communis]
MEPAKIDWKNVESIFVEDKLYETINAPKWVDFLNPGNDSLDDEAWFCRPDCNHPKTVEDFLKTATPNSKLSKSPLGSWNGRDAKLKWRGQNQSSFTPNGRSIFSEDGENQNPNLSTLPSHQANFKKSVIKSSSEKKRAVDDISHTKEPPRLKSTLSARNLFAGKDILSHISEFCNELKKMATRAKEREGDEKESQAGEEKDVVVVNEGSREVLGEVNVKEKDRKPLLEVGSGKSEGNEKGSVKEKQRRKKVIDDAENIPAPLNLGNVKHKGEERLLQIRTNPPSPQCFSATRAPTKTTTPSKSSKSRLMERGILQEVKQYKEVPKDESADKGSFSIVDGREARTLDVFWFLKPCTLSS